VGEAFFDTADRLALAETMANRDPDGFVHRSCDLTAWTCGNTYA
jgi:hypothetical protein